MRRFLYRLASLLGWVEAAKRGRLPQRAVRVLAWRRIGGLARRVRL